MHHSIVFPRQNEWAQIWQPNDCSTVYQAIEELECVVLTGQSPALQTQLLFLGQSKKCQCGALPVQAVRLCGSASSTASAAGLELHSKKGKGLSSTVGLEGDTEQGPGTFFSFPSQRQTLHSHSSKTLKCVSKNNAVILFIYKHLLHLKHREALWET